MTYRQANGMDGGAANNKYLTEQKTWLSVNSQTNQNIYATTRYTYNESGVGMKGMVRTVSEPVLNEADTQRQTSYEYDSFGNTTRVQVTDLSSARTTTTSRSHYDSMGHLLLSASSQGVVTRSRYDGLGRLYESRTYADAAAMTRPESEFIPGTYDALTPLTTTRYGYDGDGRQTLVRALSRRGTHVGGSITRTTYGLTGQVLSVERSSSWDGEEAFLAATAYEYDEQGRKKRETHDSGANGWSVEFEYDSQGRLTDQRWRDTAGTLLKHEEHAYFDSGLKKADRTYGPGGTGEVKLREVAYEYDSLKRLTHQTVDPSPGKNLQTQTGYDAQGQRTAVRDPRGYYTFFEYDNAGRLVRESFPVTGTYDLETDPSWPSTGVAKRVEYLYYPDGQKERETRYDRNGAELTYTAYEYDEQSRLTKVTQPVTGGTTAITQIAYRDPGQAPFSGGLDTGASAKRITDAEGKATFQVFDAAGRLLKIHHPDGQVEEKEYWEDGSLKSQTVYEASGNGPGQKITFEYNAEGRLQYKIYPGGSVGSMPREKCIEFQYDGLGRRTAVIDYRESAHRMGGSNQMGWSYDALGRVKTATLHDGRVLTYSFSATGQRTGISIQQGGQTEYAVSYTYAHTSGDNTDRLTEVKQNGQTVATYGWDANGSLASLEYNALGVTTSYQYNSQNQLTQIQSGANGGVCQFDYTVDDLGRRTGITEKLKRSQGGQQATYTVSYSYDKLSRLLSETRNRTSTPTATVVQDTFTYDKAGNRLTENGQSYSYSANSDKLASDPQGNAYSFDRNGNQLQKRIGANGWTYEYDWDNQLKKATHSDGRELTFWYDPDGNRIRKAVEQNGQTTTTQYVVDTQQPYAQVVEELDGNGAVTAKYLYGHDLLKVSRGGEYYYFNDGLGSVRLVVVAADGGVRNRYSYEAYGTVLAGAEDQEENTLNEYLFTGERVDADTGLVYLRARYYDPTTGRFKQLDSYLGSPNDPLTLHRYLYTSGDPVNHVDPSGHFLGTVSLAVGSFLSNLGSRIKDGAIGVIKQKITQRILAYTTRWAYRQLAMMATFSAFYSGMQTHYGSSPSTSDDDDSDRVTIYRAPVAEQIPELERSGTMEPDWTKPLHAQFLFATDDIDYAAEVYSKQSGTKVWKTTVSKHQHDEIVGHPRGWYRRQPYKGRMVVIYQTPYSPVLIDPKLGLNPMNHPWPDVFVNWEETNVP